MLFSSFRIDSMCSACVIFEIASLSPKKVFFVDGIIDFEAVFEAERENREVVAGFFRFSSLKRDLRNC